MNIGKPYDCASHALCIVSLVAVYLDLNLNSNFMFKLKSIWLFLSLFSPLGLAQPAFSPPLPSFFFPLADRPTVSLSSFSSFACARFFSIPAQLPRARSAHFLAPGPTRLSPAPSPLSLSGARAPPVGILFPAPHRTRFRVRLGPPRSSPPPAVSASGPHVQAPCGAPT
jgi:hypothetical protein